MVGGSRDSLGSRRLSSSLRRSWQRHNGREDEQLLMTDKDLQQQKAGVHGQVLTNNNHTSFSDIFLDSLNEINCCGFLFVFQKKKSNHKPCNLKILLMENLIQPNHPSVLT